MLIASIFQKNMLEVWSAGRMNDGWAYGIVRNDEKKQHPCLGLYKELPESEKEYDRNIKFETLKLILKQGYKISKEK